MSTEVPPTARQVAEALLLDTQRRGKLVAYARSHFGIALEDAEDLLQDTALELLRQRGYVGSSPHGFVFAVFRARCGRFFRTHLRRDEIFAKAADECEAIPHPAGPERMDQRLALRQALCGISSSCRRLLSAYYVEGQSLREAAERMTVAYSGVWKTINRCLRRLRECLN